MNAIFERFFICCIGRLPGFDKNTFFSSRRRIYRAWFLYGRNTVSHRVSPARGSSNGYFNSNFQPKDSSSRKCWQRVSETSKNTHVVRRVFTGNGRGIRRFGEKFSVLVFRTMVPTGGPWTHLRWTTNERI